MSTEYTGGCHCGRVRFKIEGPDALTVSQCNCSICRKSGYLALIVPRERFEVTKGEECLTEYRFNTETAQHLFCSYCGIKSFYVPRSHPEGISVNARCLDAPSVEAMTIKEFDGQNWEKQYPATINDYVLRQITPDDPRLMDELLVTFGEVFDEPATYTGKRPGPDYMHRLLGSDWFIALAATKNDAVVGGLAAYELKKFEQERSEIYLYDLAVSREHRCRGIATALIQMLRRIAAERGAYVIFVQTDTGVEDKAAIALYSRLGFREDVLHFDIPVEDPEV